MTRPYRFLSTLVKAPSDSTEQVAVESDFVVIFAALLCALVCVVGLVVVARCAWVRRRSMSGQASANKGIKKKLVEALPKLVYESGKEGKGDCAICLTEYADGDEIRVLPPCRHAFHVACIDRWLASHSSCPSCRQILRCKNCGRTETSTTVRTSTNQMV